MISVEFVKRQKLTDQVYSFWFKPQQPLRFIAGQFIELYIEHDNADDRGIKRWFTISSHPGLNEFSITTRIIKQRSSFKNALFGLREGQELKFIAPMGDFVLPKNKHTPIVFVAGGIGCTPYSSIISDLKNKNEHREIKLFHSIKNPEDAIFKDIFGYLGDDYKAIRERIDTKAMISSLVNRERYLFYISGPEPMVEDVLEELITLGVKRNMVHTDFFHGYTKI